MKKTKKEIKIPKIIKILLLLIIFFISIVILDPVLAILGMFWNISQAFVFAFGIAFLSYPIVQLLERIHIPNKLAKIIVVLLIVGFIILLGFQIIPLLTEQLPKLISSAQSGINELLNKYEIGAEISKLIGNQASIIAQFAGGILNSFIGFLGTMIMTLFIALYIIFDYENIAGSIRKYSKKKKNLYPFLKNINHELSNYTKSLWIIIVIQFVEYSFCFGLLAKHPSWLLLAILSGFSVFIPYIGGIMVNILSILTAYTVYLTEGKMSVLVWTVIICLIVPNLDSYIVQPIVYKRTVKLNPIVMLFTTIMMFSLFGIIGLFFVVPLLIAIILLRKYYGKQIKNSFKNII